MSVHKAVDNVNHILGPALLGKDIFNQEDIDHTMIQLDGTPDKSRLGGNAIYSVSHRRHARCRRCCRHAFV